MRSLIPLVLALTTLAPLQARAEPPSSTIPVRYVAQPPGPTCLAAATAMALTAQGHPIDALSIARQVPIHADGIAVLDIEELLARGGVRSWLLRADLPLLRRLFRAGVPGIVFFDATGKHAVVVHGEDSVAGTFAVRDPTRPEVTQLASAALERAWEATGRQLFVIVPGSLPEGTIPPELQGDMDAQNHRYRAIEWARRAEEHPVRGPQSWALYQRAVAEGAGIPEVTNNAALSACAAGHRDAAVELLRSALAARPDYSDAKQNLGRIESGIVSCEPRP